MNFNVDKTEEVAFFSKWLKPIYPPLFLGSDEVTVKAENKDLGMILASKVDFQSHTKEAIVKAREGEALAWKDIIPDLSLKMC